jgi:NAD-dependent SIR2 family protein deacetylase
MDAFEERLKALVDKLAGSRKLVVFTGAGLSTESGVPDFRGPDGLWTRRDKGLPVDMSTANWALVEPNSGHRAIAKLQQLGKLRFLISQNIDNLHLKSGIAPELLAELHGNLTRLRCRRCGFVMDNPGERVNCPECGGAMKSSVVDFGDSLPEKDLNLAIRHSRDCDVFLVVGSSLVVTPAADMPRLALESGADLIIINDGETPLDAYASLRFSERIGLVLPPAVDILAKVLKAV